MTCFVDSDHAGDCVSRRSKTGVLIYCDSSPILWHGKKQTSIETSSCGSEFSAMKTGIELVEGLRYKLHMMCVGLDGPTYVRADNMSVVHNSSNPASQLKKKCHSVAYHYTRERCSSGVCCVSYIPSARNLVDMLTKSQPGEVCRRLTNQVLFYFLGFWSQGLISGQRHAPIEVDCKGLFRTGSGCVVGHVGESSACYISFNDNW